MVEIVRLLLEKGADPNLSLTYEQLSLIVAIEWGNAKIVKLLLQYDANSNDVGLFDALPLMVAIEEGRVEIVRLLLNYGADFNKVSALGELPLEVAVKKGEAEIVKLLLGKKANSNASVCFGDPALIIPKENKKKSFSTKEKIVFGLLAASLGISGIVFSALHLKQNFDVSLACMIVLSVILTVISCAACYMNCVLSASSVEEILKQEEKSSLVGI
ncbi:MAG: ankyrin repeat domain-containing protein [Rickettsiaceae bacterium H1]|nr:ankyrin repeat domain-containing protein [Rickettsiaceae bacterium H1]